MKPHLISPETVRAIEEIAHETLAQTRARAEDGMAAVRNGKWESRWQVLDRHLTAIGTEVSGLLIILLALVIMCAPVGLGLLAIYGLSAWAAVAAGHPFADGWWRS